MATIGERLKRERFRLGMTQRDMAAFGGVQPNAQVSYEKNRRQLSATYLAAVGRHGVDLLYVLFGTRNYPARGVLADEAALIRNLRTLEISEQQTLVRLIATLARLTVQAV